MLRQRQSGLVFNCYAITDTGLKYIYYFFLYLFFISYTIVSAQKVQINGKVIDAQTEEPIGLVRVLLKDSALGKETNMDGEFTFELPKNRTYVFKVTYYGYKEKLDTLTVGENNIDDFQIILAPIEYSNIETITIRSKDNFADQVIRNVIRNKKYNQMSRFENYQVEAYNKAVFSLNNISKEKLNSLTLRPFRKFMLQHQSDSSLIDTNKNKNGKFKLAIFISETITEKYYDKPKKREIVKGARNTGSKDLIGEYNLLSTTLTEIDIYQNTFLLLGKQFISPVAAGAFLNYDYYWKGTEYDNGDTIYVIEIYPKSEYSYCYRGKLFISSGDWAIRRADLKLTDKANINFVESIRIKQQYEPLAPPRPRDPEDLTPANRKRCVLTSSDIYIDFINGKNAIGLYSRTSSYYKNYRFNVKFPPGFFRDEIVDKEKNADEKDSTYWEQNRLAPLERSEQLGYELYDTLMRTSWWKLAIQAIDLLSTGSKRFKYFYLGPYSQLLSFNRIEGYRVRLGIYTSPEFSKRVYIGQHVAYGFNDKRVKYDTELRYRILEKPQFDVMLYGSQEIEQAGFPNFLREGTGILNSLLLRYPFQQLNYFNEYKVSFFYEIFRNFTTTSYAKIKSIYPGFPFAFENTRRNMVVNSYHTTEVGVSLRLGIKETYVYRNGNRVYLNPEAPVFYFDWILGMKNVLGGDFNYQKYALTLSQSLPLGRFGYMNYTLTVGKILGALPYPSLYVFRGSQSFEFNPQGFPAGGVTSLIGTKNRTATFDPVSFNLMYFYEFVADEYLLFGFDHHLEGWIFNKIPLFQRLKLKEIISFRAGWGRLSNANITLNNQAAALLGLPLKAPSREPYIEVGVGIENILKFIRLDVVWRLNYHNPTRENTNISDIASRIAGFRYEYGLFAMVSLSF